MYFPFEEFKGHLYILGHRPSLADTAQDASVYSFVFYYLCFSRSFLVKFALLDINNCALLKF